MVQYFSLPGCLTSDRNLHASINPLTHGEAEEHIPLFVDGGFDGRRACALVEKKTRFVGVQLRYAFKVCSFRIGVASIIVSLHDQLIPKLCKDCWVVSYFMQGSGEVGIRKTSMGNKLQDKDT